MKRAACPNKAVNETDCPCPKTDCERHGICCLCMRYHKANRAHPLPACLR